MFKISRILSVVIMVSVVGGTLKGKTNDEDTVNAVKFLVNTNIANTKASHFLENRLTIAKTHPFITETAVNLGQAALVTMANGMISTKEYDNKVSFSNLKDAPKKDLCKVFAVTALCNVASGPVGGYFVNLSVDAIGSLFSIEKAKTEKLNLALNEVLRALAIGKFII